MRLDKLLYEFESEADRLPYVATIDADGSVIVRHSKRDDIEFPSESALDDWIKEQELDQSKVFKVEVVNSK